MRELINKSLKIFARDNVKSPAKKFDSNGLRYNVSYLKKVFPAVTGWKIEQQALFVDVVTYNEIKDPRFIPFVPSSVFFGSLTATSIGNLAYITLNYVGKDQERLKERCTKLLALIKEHFDKK